MNISTKEFNLLKQYLLRESGIDVAEEKEYLFTTRLSDLIKNEKCATFLDFYELLTSKKQPKLTQTVIELMTTHESGFFRDGHPFKVFLSDVLPQTAMQKSEQAHFMQPRLRILSAGCSFGQEPYSIAICIKQWLPTQSHFSTSDISVTGIDISARAIEKAQKGLYTDLEIGKFITTQDRVRYFTQAGQYFRISDEIRNMVSFEQVNLLKPFGNLGFFDIVFCRNVLIYFSAEGRNAVLDNIHNLLGKTGVLFLGSAESIVGSTSHFTLQIVGQTSFYTAV